MWFIPLLILLSLLAVLAWTRLKIPRDLTQEKPDYHESLLAYDRVSHMFFFIWIRYYVTRRLKRCHPQGLVVDAGCGPGYFALGLANKIPDLKILGLDISPEILRMAVRNRDQLSSLSWVQFQNASIQQLPLQNNSIDFVVSTLSLHHWTSPNLAFSEIYRVLKPGAQFLIFDLRRDSPRLLFSLIQLGQRFLAPSPIRRVNGGVGSVWSSFTPSEIQTLLSSSPFQRWQITRGWGWLYLWGQKTQV